MISLQEAFKEIEDEIIRAESHGPIFNSLHEAYAIIAEELDELWDITRQKKKNRSRLEIHQELIQIAAMSIKALRSMENFGGKPMRDSVTHPTQAIPIINHATIWEDCGRCGARHPIGECLYDLQRAQTDD